MQSPYFSLLLVVAALSTITFASYLDQEVTPSTLMMSAFAKRSAEPEPEPEAEAEPIGKSLFQFNNVNYYPPGLQDLQDTIRSGLINFKEKRSAEPEAEAEPIGKSLFQFNNVYYFPGQGLQDTIRSGLFNFKEKRSAEAKTKSTNSLLARGLSIWISLWVKQ